MMGRIGNAPPFWTSNFLFAEIEYFLLVNLEIILRCFRNALFCALVNGISPRCTLSAALHIFLIKEFGPRSIILECTERSLQIASNFIALLTAELLAIIISFHNFMLTPPYIASLAQLIVFLPLCRCINFQHLILKDFRSNSKIFRG